MENLFLFTRRTFSLAEHRLCHDKGETPSSIPEKPEKIPDPDVAGGVETREKEADGVDPGTMSSEERERAEGGDGESAEESSDDAGEGDVEQNETADIAARDAIVADLQTAFTETDGVTREQALQKALDKANAYMTDNADYPESQEWMLGEMNGFAATAEVPMTFVLKDGVVSQESTETNSEAKKESAFEEGTNGRAIEDSLNKAMETLNDPDASQEQKLMAMIQALGAIFEFIQRAFDGTLNDQRDAGKGPDAKGPDAAGAPEGTPESGAKSPEAAVVDEAGKKAGPDATPEETKKAVVENREEAEKKLNKNKERIAAIDKEYDDDQKDLKDLKGQRTDLEEQIADVEQDGGDVAELQIELDELNGKIKSIEESMAKQLELKDKLKAENTALQTQIDAAKNVETTIDQALVMFNTLIEALNKLGDGLPVKIVGLTFEEGKAKMVLAGDAATFEKWGLTPDAKGQVKVGLEDLQRILADLEKKPAEPDTKSPEAESEKPGPAKDAPVGEIRKDVDGNFWQKKESGMWGSYNNPEAGMTSDSGFRGTEWGDSLMDERGVAIVEAPEAETPEPKEGEGAPEELEGLDKQLKELNDKVASLSETVDSDVLANTALGRALSQISFEKGENGIAVSLPATLKGDVIRLAESAGWDYDAKTETISGLGKNYSLDGTSGSIKLDSSDVFGGVDGDADSQHAEANRLLDAWVRNLSENAPEDTPELGKGDGEKSPEVTDEGEYEASLEDNIPMTAEFNNFKSRMAKGTEKTAMGKALKSLDVKQDPDGKLVITTNEGASKEFAMVYRAYLAGSTEEAVYSASTLCLKMKDGAQSQLAYMLKRVDAFFADEKKEDGGSEKEPPAAEPSPEPESAEPPTEEAPEKGPEDVAADIEARLPDIASAIHNGDLPGAQRIVADLNAAVDLARGGVSGLDEYLATAVGELEGNAFEDYESGQQFELTYDGGALQLEETTPAKKTEPVKPSDTPDRKSPEVVEDSPEGRIKDAIKNLRVEVGTMGRGGDENPRVQAILDGITQELSGIDSKADTSVLVDSLIDAAEPIVDATGNDWRMVENDNRITLRLIEKKAPPVS